MALNGIAVVAQSSENGSTAKLVPRKSSEKSLIADLFEHMTTVVHSSIVVFTGYIIWLCVKEDKWTLTTWHVLTYSIGWLLFMTEGILMLTKDNIYSKRLSHALRVQFHWIVEAFAMIFSLAGFLCIYIAKENRNGKHFVSDHALYGLISICFCAPTCLNGITALFAIEMKNLIRPGLHKLIHAVCGIATLLVGGASMVLGLYTGWYKGQTGDSDFAFGAGYAVLVGSFLWCIIKPTLTAFDRFKAMF